MDKSRLRPGMRMAVAIAPRMLIALAVALWASPAWAGIGALGGPGGLGSGFSALASLQALFASNIAMVASIAVLGIGLVLAFSKSSWMELVGALAFVATLGVTVTWAASNTGTFFGSGALVP